MIRLNPERFVFVTERHLATLTTLRPDGTPHVVPVAFTWDATRGVALVTTTSTSMKARHLRDHGPGRGALCQVDGGRWITLEGVVDLDDDPGQVALAEAAHARRYARLDPDPQRVVLRVEVDRVMSSDYMA